MRILKYALLNLFTMFIVIDATIGLTIASPYMANLLPFYVACLLMLSFVFFFAVVLNLATFDGFGDEAKFNLKDKLYRVGKGRRVFNTVLDISIAVFMAMFGFLWSAIFYLLHWIISMVANVLKDSLLDEIDKWYAGKCHK